MKKLLAAAVAVLLCCSATFAQTTKEKSKFGFKTGLNFSNFRTAVNYEEVGVKPKVGLVFGAFVNIPLSSRFSLQPEFLYSQMGSKSSSILWPSYVTFRYNYFSMPLLTKYKVSKGFNVFAGIEADILIRARQKGNPTKTITYDINDFDFVWTVGAGTSSKNWTFDFRYFLGTQDVSVRIDATTFFNQGFQATIGYILKNKVKKTKKVK